MTKSPHKDRTRSMRACVLCYISSREEFTRLDFSQDSLPPSTCGRTAGEEPSERLRLSATTAEAFLWLRSSSSQTTNRSEWKTILSVTSVSV